MDIGLENISVNKRVDTRLFITCRLCVEDLGVYQILPCVKQQIKYCFDIDVDPFDGLPQLICQKCENILSDYFKTKKLFTEKQTQLKNRENCLQSQQQTVSSSQQIESDSNDVTPSLSKRKRTFPSTSSEEEEDNGSTKNNITPVVVPDISTPKNNWQLGYRKQYVCKLCNCESSTIKNKSVLMRHLKGHNLLKEKYPMVFKKHCAVKLEKLDGKPNFTGSDNNVVYRKDKVIQSVFEDYLLVYKSNNSCENSPVRNRLESVVYNSDDNTEGCHTKKYRPYSRSSNETVVIDSNKKKYDETDQLEKNESICIDLDDSSEEANEKSKSTSEPKLTKTKTLPPESPVKALEADYKVIQHIISVCHTKYVKKSEKSTILESNLNRKVLGIGRRVITKKGFNCIGLLRYMEHKNLEIDWSPNGPKDLPRLMMNIRSTATDTSEGWHDVFYGSEPDELVDYDCTEAKEEPAEPPQPDVLPLCIQDTKSLTDSKLLNASPVANPKQLPKKSIIDESKMRMMTITPVENEENMFMPIITSTTSLAPGANVKKDASKQPSAPPPEPAAFPRIKVKPVSELMSDKALTSFASPADKRGNASLHPVKVYVSQPSSGAVQLSYIEKPSSSSLQDGDFASDVQQNMSAEQSMDFIVLDTVEFPNTKTDSPFRYFRSLLLLHNITLLDPDAALTSNFVCLIKFKVLYKQETKDQPVVLCLSLHCHKNYFCLKVKDRNMENIDMLKISANWQWEILKIYTGDVVKKLLVNSEKVGMEEFQYTNSFLCLLKSISLK